MRDQSRIKPAGTLHAAFASAAARGEGRVGDLSSEGIFVDSPMLLGEGEWVRISFCTPDDRRIDVEGAVRWHTGQTSLLPDRCGFGVRLSRFGTDYSAFLNELRGGSEGPEPGA